MKGEQVLVCTAHANPSEVSFVIRQLYIWFYL